MHERLRLLRLLEAAIQEPGSDRTKLHDLIEMLVEPVNRYFDDVLVNCEDEAVRANRHAFLLALSRMVGNFCYFPEIVADQGEG